MTPIELRFTLPYPPSANAYWRSVNGRVLVSAKARAYKEDVRWVARDAGAQVLEGPLVVSVDVYRPRKIGDLDNVLKVLLDSMRGICFEDDKQIVEIRARRFDDKENPRVELAICEFIPEVQE